MARWVYRRPSFTSFLTRVRRWRSPVPSVITPPEPTEREVVPGFRQLNDDPLFSFLLNSFSAASVRLRDLQAVGVSSFRSGLAASLRKLDDSPRISVRLKSVG